MSNQQDGKIIAVQFGSDTLLGRVSSDWSITVDTVETTTADNAGGAKTYLPGEFGATLNVSGLQGLKNESASPQKVLFSVAKNKTVATLIWGSTTGGELSYSAQAFVTSFSPTANKNEALGYSATFQITGEITEVVNTSS